MPDRKDMDEFEAVEIETGEASIFARWSGSGRPVLLLHGFPQTHLMWRDVAPILARTFTVVCADLRGYGRSGCPTSTSDHSPYAKRTMARDMVAVMDRLGHSSFFVAGHDRGARVAYRMAMDHPRRVDRLAVLDIVPTAAAWDRSDARFALAYWPWSLLAQPEPLPERVLATAAEAIVDDALSAWGTPPGVFTPEVRAAYIEALGDPAHAHAICEEYRAAATLDRAHDEADRLGGKRISCPLLALWSATGSLDFPYSDEGGPLGLWRNWASAVEGRSIDGGHFFPEEAPAETADALHRFFTRSPLEPRELTDMSVRSCERGKRSASSCCVVLRCKESGRNPRQRDSIMATLDPRCAVGLKAARNAFRAEAKVDESALMLAYQRYSGYLCEQGSRCDWSSCRSRVRCRHREWRLRNRTRTRADWPP